MNYVGKNDTGTDGWVGEWLWQLEDRGHVIVGEGTEHYKMDDFVSSQLQLCHADLQ